MKFGLNKDNQFGELGWTGYPYSSKDDFPNASAAYFEVTGKRDGVKSVVSDRVYYVIDGFGKFIISGEESSVAKGDVVIVPKNTTYGYRAVEGMLKLFLVHTPAYNPELEERAN